MESKTNSNLSLPVIFAILVADFALGLLMLHYFGAGQTGLRFSVKASAVLLPFWIAGFLFARKQRGNDALWMVAVFPNPLAATVLVLVLAAVTGGGTL